MMVKRARPSEEDLVNESQSVPETEITRFEIEIKASRTLPLDFFDQKNIFSLKTSVLLNFLILQFCQICHSAVRIRQARVQEHLQKYLHQRKIHSKPFNIESEVQSMAMGMTNGF